MDAVTRSEYTVLILGTVLITGIVLFLFPTQSYTTQAACNDEVCIDFYNDVRVE